MQDLGTPARSPGLAYSANPHVLGPRRVRDTKLCCLYVCGSARPSPLDWDKWEGEHWEAVVPPRVPPRPPVEAQDLEQLIPEHHLEQPRPH